MQTTFIAHKNKLMKLSAKSFILRMNDTKIIMFGAVMVHVNSQVTPYGCETQHSTRSCANISRAVDRPV